MTESGSEENFTCGVCGLHYLDRQSALECEEWCRKNKSCNMEITSRSLEARKRSIYRI